jgi:hypothetical protein
MLKYITDRVDSKGWAALAFLGFVGWCLWYSTNGKEEYIEKCYQRVIAKYGDPGGRTVSSPYSHELPVEVVERTCMRKHALYREGLTTSYMVTALDLALSVDDDGKVLRAFYWLRTEGCHKDQRDGLGRSQCEELGD